MGRLWPDGGPWVVVPTSAGVDWEAAVAALAAASSVRVAVVAIGGPVGRARPAVATRAELRDTGADPLTLTETFDLVSTLALTHGLVLVAGVPGLLVPVGEAGWTMTDLAARLGAPVVVVTGEDPDAANHTTLALGALTGRGLAGTVVTVGGPATPERLAPMDRTAAGPAGGPPPMPERAEDGVTAATDGGTPAAAPADREARAGSGTDPGAAAQGATDAEAPAPGDLADRLPVTPAGRIPAGVDVSDREAARGYLNPMLHASSGRDPESAPAARPAVPAAPPVTSGVRVALALIALFVTMSLAAVGLAFCDRPESREVTAGWTAAPSPRVPAPTPSPSLTGVPVAQVCPVDQLDGEPARPGADVTSRVDGAWERIETWLAAKAPASHASLRPGARAADIDAAQERMSVAFPPDLVASLLRHDGAEGGDFPLPFMHEPVSVARIVQDRQMLCRVLADSFPDLDWWWNEGYIPFANSGAGARLFIDQRRDSPVPGRIGLFHDEDGGHFDDDWPTSVAELLEQTATSLETGQPFAGHYRPALTGDRLEWIML
ncbi:cell wall assembly regulator SMI1 [Catenuloplanes nepalensis]|uniref:Cell wall assembly regulator SMI1 n=1 Tax=Catenuloplanes nepalensis TaxID=587533 RepID=A0ABT9MST0_9ACTN|nr:SMI1/KNR4 family protein [Catenuloplanes nepalensis]MDP9794499.1 cell wall assembly regulator SMI1 [Catenuloplanes nepalensis]